MHVLAENQSFDFCQLRGLTVYLSHRARLLKGTRHHWSARNGSTGPIYDVSANSSVQVRELRNYHY
jgi:hypothetical protein